jgi:hypothetical protein
MLITGIKLSHNYSINTIVAKYHHRVKYKVAANFPAVEQKDSLQKLYCFWASTTVGLV